MQVFVPHGYELHDNVELLQPHGQSLGALGAGWQPNKSSHVPVLYSISVLGSKQYELSAAHDIGVPELHCPLASQLSPIVQTLPSSHVEPSSIFV